MLRYPRGLRAVVLMCVAGLVLAGAPASAATGAGAGARAATAAAKPSFQLPFPCGTTWEMHTWAHNPALDMVVEGNTGSDGLPVQASAAGTVSATYWNNGSGNTIQISHGNGWFTAYYHLKDDPAAYVKKGDPVLPSTRIGRIGTSGASGWAHLHYEQRYLATGGDFTDESNRVPVHFDGVEYAGPSKDWTGVTSRNCTGVPPAWQDCPSGYVCFYSGADGTGTVCRSAGNEPNSTCGLRKSFFNNGTADPGYDHIQVNFAEGGSTCLHYGWSEGRGNLPTGGRTVQSFQWRGEC
ncbi:peptidoglycan DD-metalloendopeptidase family protein [Streptomyces sp. H27-H1]|uniref:peptidoglycan DD-metalloendopeptidase family protein n=1 Tax=Streptomyces sp. H27-H1 TaxID=2996461 RepID=UPI00226E1CBC|nr:peptidoglycan DD-metalloendopeptidase family protein [Streptomyces sp. H27-H1]MCY0925341.1 peptidoglycan DD-metalloendopeptidase family protein [Streptomyces sp. H27-H1]